MIKRRNKMILGLETLILISIFVLGTPLVQGAREPSPFFTVTIMLPTNNLERLQYSEAIAEELAKIGIDVDLEMKTWAEILPRVFYDEAPPYDEGGFDICFYGMVVGSVTSHPGALMKYQYQDIPPDGANVMHWSPDREDQMNYLAASSNDLIDSINQNTNLTDAKSDFHEWQKVWYEALPNNMIYSQSEVSVISNGLFGFDPLMDPLASLETFWTNSTFAGDNETIILAASQITDNFNAIFTGGLTDVDHYNAYPPLDSLIGFTPSKELILPSDVNREEWIEENFNTSEFLELYPRVASELGQYSSDGLQYNISVREDVLWHDGHRLDAWDVAFSFQTQLIFGVFDNEWVESIGESPNPEDNEGIYSFIVEDKNNDSFSESISYQFVNSYSPFESNILGFPLLPEHILGDPLNHGYIDGNSSANFNISQWNVQPNQWASHSFNTGNPAHPGGLYGPIGCGSVVFKGYNSLTREISLQKFENIQWDHSTSSWVTNNSNDHYLVNDGKLLTMPTTIKTIVETNEDNAIESMKTGQVNILDPLFTDVFFSDTTDLRSLVDELLLESAIRPIISGGSIYQALYFNPKFEQGGINHLNLKGVRHAVSHMIPRLEIIDQLLNGLGTPSFSPLLSTSWATIPENELIDYKRTVKASDGSKPEENATTAYDQYSIKTALAWLKTEGYDTSRWEVYHGFKPPKPATSYDLFIVSIALISTSLFVRKKRST